MKAMIWRTCLNHNGSLCHPEVRWCEFYPDPPPPIRSSFDPLEDICRSCVHAVAVVRENRCPFCAGSTLGWSSPKSVLTSLADPEYLYHYACRDCGKEVFSKELILANPRIGSEDAESGGLDG
jgi:hypothetical protein